MTYGQFAKEASYLLSHIAKWVAGCVTDPADEMRERQVDEFCEMLRAFADHIEKRKDQT